ncbi:MAG: hypothetical protein JNM69_14210, partial [Archangium sp.]|nr:hypothetical protein [Archangium sp.]
MNRWLSGVVLAALAACSGETVSQPANALRQALAPANDHCANATPIGLGVPVQGTTIDATDDLNCAYLWGADVAYGFTPPTSGFFRAQVVGTMADGGAIDPFSAACQDGGCYFPVVRLSSGCDAGICSGSATTYRFAASAGAAQNVIVDSYSGSGTFSLVVNTVTPAVNDTCNSPTVLPVGTPVALDLANAFDDFSYGDGGCGSPADDLFYSFTPAVSGRYRFSITAGQVSLLASACSTSCLGTGGPQVQADLTAGVTVFVVAEPQPAWWSPTMTLTAQLMARPPNDLCPAATAVTLNTPVRGTTLGATNEVQCPGPESDVFYRFMPATTGAFNVSVTGTDAGVYGTRLGFGSGCADGGLTCSAYATSSENFRATAGTPVTMFVQGFEQEFDLTVRSITPPANDTCAGAATLPLSTWVTASLDNAVDDLPASGLPCGTPGQREVVYTFVAPTTGDYRFVSQAQFEASTGTCGGASCFASQYGWRSGNDQLDLTLASGTTVWVIVESGYGTSPRLRVDRLQPPPNDSCSNAQTLSLGVPVQGTTRDARQEFACLSEADVFYRFTPPASGGYRVTIQPDTSDGGFAIVSVLPNGCVADAGTCGEGTSSSLAFRGVASQSVTFGVSSPMPNDFSLRVDAFTVAANDTCAAPQALTEGVPVPVSFANAFDDPFPSSDGGFPSCGTSARDLVFSFTPTVSGRYDFQSPGFAQLSTGSCGVGCINSGNSLAATLVAGTTVWLIAEDYGLQSGVVRVDYVPTPANDQCTAPQAISLGTTVQGTTRGATANLSCSGFDDGVDVFYSA